MFSDSTLDRSSSNSDAGVTILRRPRFLSLWVCSILSIRSIIYYCYTVICTVVDFGRREDDSGRDHVSKTGISRKNYGSVPQYITPTGSE